MDVTLRPVRLLAMLGIVAGVAGCGASDSAWPRSIALSLSSSGMTVTQGGTGAVTVTVSRANFSGTITLSASSLPDGVAASFTPSLLTGQGTSSTLVLSAAADATVGPGTVAIEAQGEGVDDRAATLALSVTPAGDFVVDVEPTTLAVPQSGHTSTTVTVSRSGGMTGDVSLGVAGLPSGVTATFAPARLGITAATSTLTLTTAGDASSGTARLTITGTSPGLAVRQSALDLNVTPAVGTPVSVRFCANGLPRWVAYQNDGGGWTRAPLLNGTATFAATGTRVGVAAAWADENGSQVEVSYVTTGELASIGRTHCIVDGNTVHGSVAGLGESQSAEIALGTARTITGADGPFDLTGVAGGALDLIAVRSVDQEDLSSTPDRVVVRRGVALSSGTTLPVIDFGSTEAAAPATATLSARGAIGDWLLVGSSILTANATRFDFDDQFATNGVGTVYGLTPTMQLGSDLYVFRASEEKENSRRSARRYARTFGSASLALGPPMSASTLTVAADSPSVRIRVQLPKQAEYGSLFHALFTLSPYSFASASISITMSPAYLGEGTTWDVTIPDLSAVPGWDPAWALDYSAVNNNEVSVVGASYDPFTAMADDGATEVEAERWSIPPLAVSRGLPEKSAFRFSSRGSR